MTNEKKQILIVDDSPDDIHFLMPTLAQEYAVLVATSGEKALKMVANEPRPDVILMDVEMPGMNGYETCHCLKDDSETAEIDVIFISSHDTSDEIIAGYEAGGSDYLTKPVQPVELLQKIKLSIDNQNSRLAAKAEQEITMEAAMTAIYGAGELGIIINFMQQSFTTNNINELANLIVDSMTEYDLNSSVQIRTPYTRINVTSGQNPMLPLEQELLFRLKDSGRIMEKGKRFIINFGDISLLVKNMPDGDMRGRLRDHLALLLEGAESRLKALLLQKELTSVLSDTNVSLVEIEVLQKEQKETAMQIMDDVMFDLESSFTSYGLTEGQEKYLLDVVQKGVNKSLKNLEKGVKIDEQLQKIIQRLAKLGT